MLRSAAGNAYAGGGLRMRVGVNTGPVVVGAKGRLTYTVHGDAVNRAARIETMNKELGTTLLISDATVAGLDEADMREVGTMSVRGQSAPVTLYTPGS